jgi:hypothetical protein
LQAGAVDVLGGELTGRLYAAGALFLAGFAPMVLLRRARWYARCVAGVLGILNPWVYDRMVEGQWGVVVAAAGLFLWVAAWEALQARPGARRALVLALCGAAIVAFAPQMLGPAVVLAIAAAAASRPWRDRSRLRWSAASVAMLAALLSYGTISFFAGGHQGTYAAVRQFTRADFAFFRSVPSQTYGLLVNLVGLYGYWGERIGRFPVLNQGAVWWPLTTAAVVGAAVAGAYFERTRAWLLPCGLIGVVVSASTALPGGLDAAAWAAKHVPLVGAYREPQKWDALWLLALVTLAAVAIERAARAWQRAGPALAYALVLAALFPAGVSQIRALPSIVKPLQYPGYWYRTREYLAAEVPRNAPVVILPWHLYQPLVASEGRLVANPARRFFPGRLIVPNNLEIPGRFTDVTSRYDRIGRVAATKGYRSCAVTGALRRESVQWVVVLDAAEAREAVAGLRRCGFSLVQGAPGRTAVLRARLGRAVLDSAVHG